MEPDKKNTPDRLGAGDAETVTPSTDSAAAMPPEVNGPKGPEPTRYGDWEQKGRCTDF
jgi:hypothetical protein